jgi:hypothetical protein
MRDTTEIYIVFERTGGAKKKGRLRDANKSSEMQNIIKEISSSGGGRFRKQILLKYIKPAERVQVKQNKKDCITLLSENSLKKFRDMQ